MARYGARADRALTAGAHVSEVAKARRESRAQAQGRESAGRGIAGGGCEHVRC